jgi:hypothetical protein
MTSLVERLYQYEDVDFERKLWERPPFALFAPNCHFLRFKPVVRALRGENRFFETEVKYNFFPDKTPEQAIEAKMHAMNRGIKALNDLCQLYVPEVSDYLRIDDVASPFDPIQFFGESREDWIKARNGLHPEKLLQLGDKDLKNKELIRKAYEAVRAWGLGHFILLIDESPEAYHSVSHIPALNQWLFETMGFRDPQHTANGVAWATRAGVRVYGTKEMPFRHRAKIHDDNGKIRYGSLLMKMFLKGGFLEEVHDSYAVEFLVNSEEDEGEILDFFRNNIKSTGRLEKFKRFREDGPPAFYRTKFLLRVPVRLYDPYQESDSLDLQPGVTLRAPLTRYVRPTVEVQIRNMNHPYQHDLYKLQQYMRVFPMWYPREIYGTFLESIDGKTSQ